MIGFRIKINEKKFLKVALNRDGVASLIFALHRTMLEGAPDSIESITLQAGSLESHPNFTKQKAWPSKRLSKGDKILVEITEIDEISPCKITGKETKESQTRKKIAYLGKLKRELKLRD